MVLLICSNNDKQQRNCTVEYLMPMYVENSVKQGEWS